jgi:hypothetical protein
MEVLGSIVTYQSADFIYTEEFGIVEPLRTLPHDFHNISFGGFDRVLICFNIL